ncbi:MAG: complex I NDUFA9 subunit family protein [Rubrivivax sp.]|nr:complex I NDUFA9 subunit family protein [Rubrivivax sp.]
MTTPNTPAAIGRILILGGTGFVGRTLCEKLAEADPATRLVVPTRRLKHGAAMRVLPTIDLQQADVHDDATLQRLVAGCSAVVNLVAILHGSAAAFEHVHVALPRRLAAACLNAGVRRVVQVSALGIATSNAPPGQTAPSDYLRSKTQGEAVLRDSGLALTLLRPSVIFGAEDRFTNLFAELQQVAPVIPLAGSNARFQPVWVDDVAAAIVRCLQDPATVGVTYECTGPDEMTLSQIVRYAGRWAGCERPQIALPGWAATLQARTMEWLPGGPLMSRDNLRSMQVPNVASGLLPGLPALGIEPTAMAAVAPGYLQARFQRPLLDRWRARAHRG